MEKNKKYTVSKEVEALFNKMTKNATDIDTSESRRRVLFYTNKINKEAQIDKESLRMEFSV